MGVGLSSAERLHGALESQIASSAAVHREIYFASREDRATTLCFLDLQGISPSVIFKTEPSVDLRDLEPLAQSESE